MAESLESQIKRLESENATLKKRSAITFKVSVKGAVSAYGLGRFPVTLYKEQWTRILEKSDDLRAFMKANDRSLSVKD